MSTVGDELRILTGQALVVEHFVFTTAYETRVSFYARDEPVAVTGHGEAGEGPELGRLRVGRHFSWAFEADDS